MDAPKKTILVVDDMISILEHAKQILKDSYKVIPCTSGAQMLGLVGKVKPGLILLDVNMPDMDGYEAMAKLKENDETKDIPVIFVTANLTVDEEEKGFKLGAVDFIMKPFSQISMLKRIEMHIA